MINFHQQMTMAYSFDNFYFECLHLIKFIYFDCCYSNLCSLILTEQNFMNYFLNKFSLFHWQMSFIDMVFLVFLILFTLYCWPSLLIKHLLHSSNFIVHCSDYSKFKIDASDPLNNSNLNLLFYVLVGLSCFDCLTSILFIRFSVIPCFDTQILAMASFIFLHYSKNRLLFDFVVNHFW